jgi:hypothetical protein
MAGASASIGCEGGGAAASPGIAFATIDAAAHPPSIGATSVRTSQRIEKRTSISEVREIKKLMFLKLGASDSAEKSQSLDKFGLWKPCDVRRREQGPM